MAVEISECEADMLTQSIERMLDELPPRPQTPSIRRVDDVLRRTNHSAYDPRVVSIGPFHRGKPHLHGMEQEKKRCLKQLLRSEDGLCVHMYVEKVRELQDRARMCYSEPITLGGDEFVEMLLLDGIFILQFLRTCIRGFPTAPPSGVASPTCDDGIFEMQHVRHDLLLLENQIPFFVIEELYILTQAHHGPENISSLVHHLAHFYMPDQHLAACELALQTDHLLAAVHRVLCYSFCNICARRSSERTGPSNINGEELVQINSARELTEGGIELKKRVNCDSMSSWLDIQFKNKKIYIPVWDISDETESLFRNLIAYEYYLPAEDPKYITDYVYFFHCLIHSPMDAQLLRRSGIINNLLGGDEMVYQLVNRMGANVWLHPEKMSYLDVLGDVRRHCEQRRNRWVAILRQDYFNSPWKLISIVAGVVVLGVGIVQMVFAILSYYHDMKKDS